MDSSLCPKCSDHSGSFLWKWMKNRSWRKPPRNLQNITSQAVVQRDTYTQIWQHQLSQQPRQHPAQRRSPRPGDHSTEERNPGNQQVLADNLAPVLARRLCPPKPCRSLSPSHEPALCCRGTQIMSHHSPVCRNSSHGLPGSLNSSQPTVNLRYRVACLLKSTHFRDLPC